MREDDACFAPLHPPARQTVRLRAPGQDRWLVVVATEDNLLKGAATQALRNLNLAFGLDELAEIPA
jgi:N-acetyl-gamma-glutamyl-phosphate reductase (EC 1.2.1.38)